MSVILAWSSSG